MPATYANHRAQLKAILGAWGMPEDNAEITAEFAEVFDSPAGGCGAEFFIGTVDGGAFFYEQSYNGSMTVQRCIMQWRGAGIEC